MVEQVGRARGMAFQLRLEDVANANADMYAVCWFCKHEAKLDVTKLVAEWSKHERLINLEDKLRCGHCQARGGVMTKLRIEWPPA